MSSVKDICCNPRLHDLVLAVGRHVARRCRRWAHASVIHAASHFTMRKELHGFLFLCMHVILYVQPYVLVVGGGNG